MNAPAAHQPKIAAATVGHWIDGRAVAGAGRAAPRGIEVVEFACGIPHLLKGEFTDNVGTGIDSYSMRQPLGVVAGITPFNFPAMVPMWMFPSRSPAATPSSSSPPSATRRLDAAGRAAEEAGLPDGVFNVVTATRKRSTRCSTHPDVKAVSFVGSTPIARIHLRDRRAHGKRVQALGGAKNHMVVMPDADLDQATDALIGAGYGSAGERCMAISVAVRSATSADALIEQAGPRARALKIGPGDRSRRRDGPAGHRRHRDGRGLHRARRRGAQAGRRRPRLQGAGLRERLLPRRHAVRPRHAGHAHLQGGDLRPGAVVVRVADYAAASSWSTTTNTATASRSSPATATPRAPSPPRSGRHGRHQRADPGADGLPQLRRLEALAVRRPPHAYGDGGRALLHAAQDRSAPSACRRGDAGDALLEHRWRAQQRQRRAEPEHRGLDFRAAVRGCGRIRRRATPAGTRTGRRRRWRDQLLDDTLPAARCCTGCGCAARAGCAPGAPCSRQPPRLAGRAGITS
jgi:hypothetical protein